MGRRQQCTTGISADKERERQEIASQIQQFLRRGGNIEQLQPPGFVRQEMPLHRPVNLEPWL